MCMPLPCCIRCFFKSRLIFNTSRDKAADHPREMPFQPDRLRRPNAVRDPGLEVPSAPPRRPVPSLSSRYSLRPSNAFKIVTASLQMSFPPTLVPLPSPSSRPILPVPRRKVNRGILNNFF